MHFLHNVVTNPLCSSSIHNDIVVLKMNLQYKNCKKPHSYFNITMTSEIEKFFKDQTVFITGGTGFLGKVLIEKLLRVCEPKKINVLIRPKKGKSTEERIDDFFNFPCFDRVKNGLTDYKRIVNFVPGDCEANNLGISEEDEEMLIKETTVVIHAAANVKFDQHLRDAANANVKSTINIIILAKEMHLLKAFVYVSTAFSNCIHKEVKEEFYPPPMSHHQFLSLLDGVDDATLEAITPTLLGKYPNTYIYTKCISEDVVKTLAKDLPVAVVRPAVVVNTIEEPMPGWIDNFYGVIGVGMGCLMGAIKVLHLVSRYHILIVPVDYVANLTLAACWNIQNQKRMTIYNFAGHKDNMIDFDRFIQITKSVQTYFPTEKMVWIYSLHLIENKLWFEICHFFLHTVPAYIADGVLFCLGKPTFVVKTYRKVNKALSMLMQFGRNEWVFEDKNLMEMWARMADEDKKLFKFSMETCDWYKFVRDGCLGSISYLLKVPEIKNSKFAPKRIILYVLHYTIIILFWLLVYKCIRLIFVNFL